MTNNGKKAGNRINENEMCMLCGNSKQKGKLVCYKCFLKWQLDRKSSLVESLEDVTLLEWTLEKAKETSSILNTELSQAKKALDSFKAEMQQKAYEEIKAALRNGGLSKDEFSDIIAARRQKLWEEGDGNKLFGRCKFLEFRAEKLPEFIKDLEEKATSKDQEPSQDSEETNG